MFDIRTHPEVDDELEDAIRYLLERTLWQASKFADAAHAALLQIRNHPSSGHFIWREFRHHNLQRFPYALVYRCRANEVFVIAVMHEKRHPDYWKHRIEDDASE